METSPTALGRPCGEVYKWPRAFAIRGWRGTDQVGGKSARALVKAGKAKTSLDPQGPKGGGRHLRAWLVEALAVHATSENPENPEVERPGDYDESVSSGYTGEGT